MIIVHIKKRDIKEQDCKLEDLVDMTELDTRENILNESFHQFIERSYHKVSIDRICTKLGISKGAVFHYFNSKYDLACESLYQGFNKLWSPHLKQIIDKGTPQEKLTQFIRSAVQMFMEHPTLCRFSHEIFEEGAGKQNVNNEWLKSNRDHLNLATKLYEECGISNPEGKARLLIAALDGLSFFFILEDLEEQLDAETISKDLIEMYVP